MGIVLVLFYTSVLLKIQSLISQGSYFAITGRKRMNLTDYRIRGRPLGATLVIDVLIYLTSSVNSLKSAPCFFTFMYEMSYSVTSTELC